METLSVETLDLSGDELYPFSHFRLELHNTENTAVDAGDRQMMRKRIKQFGLSNITFTFRRVDTLALEVWTGKLTAGKLTPRLPPRHGDINLEYWRTLTQVVADQIEKRFGRKLLFALEPQNDHQRFIDHGAVFCNIVPPRGDYGIPTVTVAPGIVYRPIALVPEIDWSAGLGYDEQHLTVAIQHPRTGNWSHFRYLPDVIIEPGEGYASYALDLVGVTLDDVCTALEKALQETFDTKTLAYHIQFGPSYASPHIELKRQYPAPGA